MEDILLVFEISFNLEVFLMKAPRGRIFLINSGLFNLSFVMENSPPLESTILLAIMLNSYDSFRAIAYATLILHEKDDSIYFRFRNVVYILLDGWFRGRMIFLCRILGIGEREELL